MSAHAVEEIDLLDIVDIEASILNGHVARVESDDPRGMKYVVEGIAANRKTPVGVVGRFTEGNRYLIITVYEISEMQE